MPTKTQFKTKIEKRYQNGESSHQISADEGCSYNAVLRELKRKGINTGLCFWDKKEIEKLKKFYSIMPQNELFKEFPNRKMGSIKGMARKLRLKKSESKKICKSCGEEFIDKFNRGREFCSQCVKEQWEHNNLKNKNERQKRWLRKHPEYLKRYLKCPEVKKRIQQYFKRLRKENPKFHLDTNMGVAVYQALKSKKAGRRWEILVGYTLEELIAHLEKQFDIQMNWNNYGGYWHVDHIKPKSLFKYTSPDDSEFKKCWALENLQPLERIANLKKSNIFVL